MEDLFYALGILLSGSLIFHYFSQFGISLWSIYFVVAQMWHFMSQHQPWDPVQDAIDEAISGTVVDNLPSLCDAAGGLSSRKKKGGGGSGGGSGGGKGGGKGGKKGGRNRQHGICTDDGWKGDPLAMTIVSGFYAAVCALLLLWVVYIFVRVIRLGRRQQGAAIRTVLHMTANRLATPAIAASIFLAWYMVWGYWTWFTQCRPTTNISYANLANALLLTVPTAIITVAWLVGTGCEIAHHVRSQRQDDIPLPNLAPRRQDGSQVVLDLRALAASLPRPERRGGGVSVTLVLLRSPVF